MDFVVPFILLSNSHSEKSSIVLYPILKFLSGVRLFTQIKCKFANINVFISPLFALISSM